MVQFIYYAKDYSFAAMLVKYAVKLVPSILVASYSAVQPNIQINAHLN